MDVANTVLMQGDPQLAFKLAAAVEDWPRLLPHYRSVRILEEQGQRRHVRMAAWRTGIPVAWTAWQEVLPAEDRITYRHTGGRLIGMEVVWSFRPVPDGVEVQITHHYTPEYRWLPQSWQPWLAEHVAGRFFVQHIAGQTLRVLRDHVEAARVHPGPHPDPPPLRQGRERTVPSPRRGGHSGADPSAGGG